MSSIKSVNKQGITDEVYEQFKNAIASGEWSAGKKIPPERELVTMTGASRVSVRGALQRLATLGVIDSRQGEGTFVCHPQGGEYINVLLPLILSSKPQIDDLLEFRLIIETQSARLAAERRSDEDIRLMWESYERHKVCGDDRNLAAECDFQFHTLIANATGNSLIRQVYSVLTDVFKTSLYDIVHVMGSHNAVYYHNTILSAIEIGDGAAAMQQMRDHILDTMDAFAPPEKGKKKDSANLF